MEAETIRISVPGMHCVRLSSRWKTALMPRFRLAGTATVLLVGWLLGLDVSSFDLREHDPRVCLELRLPKLPDFSLL